MFVWRLVVDFGLLVTHIIILYNIIIRYHKTMVEMPKKINFFLIKPYLSWIKKTDLFILNNKLNIYNWFILIIIKQKLNINYYSTLIFITPIILRNFSYLQSFPTMVFSWKNTLILLSPKQLIQRPYLKFPFTSYWARNFFWVIVKYDWCDIKLK